MIKRTLTDAFNAVRNYPYRRTMRELIDDTPIEVALGAALLSVTFGSASCLLSSRDANMVPTAFSEIGAIRRTDERTGHEVPPLTRFYAKTNDTVMKVMEARNIAEKEGGSDKAFARELEFKMAPELKVHHLISEYATEIPGDAKDALYVVKKLSDTADDVPAVVDAFDAVWDEEHDDVYRTEYYTEEVCTGTGKDRSCHDEPRTRQVYDHTDHTYTYYRDRGYRARNVLDAFLQTHPDVDIAERLELPTETGADNEYAIETSLKEALKGKIVTPDEALHYARVWANGSNFDVHLPVIRGNHASLERLSPEWRKAARTAHSTSYSTYSHSDSGPAEYQVTRQIMDHAQTVHDLSRAVTGGIAWAGTNVPRLNAQIKNFIEVTLDGKPGDSGDLRDDLMDNALNIYRKNYIKGFELDPFHMSTPLMWTLIGLAAGAALGAGADQLNKKRRWARRDGPYSRY